MATNLLTQLNPFTLVGVGTLPAGHLLGWQITTAGAQDLVTALSVISTAGYTGTATCAPGGVWTMTVAKPNLPTQPGGQNDWIVFDGTTATVMPNSSVVAQYTANIPVVWAATTTAPTVTRQGTSGTSVALTFPPPTSANSPWTYTVTQTTGGVSTPATLLSAPVTANGTVTATVTGLTAGSWTFTVTVATQYSGVTATSAVTSPVSLP